MKLAVRLLLIVFISFLATPTIVGMIKHKCDTSIFYSMSEEEIHKELKEIKAEIVFHSIDLFKISKHTSSIIISENLMKHDNVSASIFSPPPNV
ncbi:hypothetical protein ACI6PS_14190 [Flavobacterium sp. PLA-1-15]|uniref:hypothetical protein n=1 Tax=Flavobacterium sp. PLA-1-15 TaxID=3380533 RepID=UPI003B792C24